MPSELGDEPEDPPTSQNAGETTLLLSPESNASTLTLTSHQVLRKLIAAILLFITAVAMTVPVRPRLILDAASEDTTLASTFTGVVESLQSVIAIFSSPLFGAVSDVIGRKPMLILAHLGEFIGLLIVAQFPHSLSAQFPAYLLIALTNAYVITVNTMVADVSRHDVLSSATNYGYIGATFGLCFLIGPALGGIIEDNFYLASSFHVACVIIALAMLFVYFIVPETKQSTSLNAPPATESDASMEQPPLTRADTASPREVMSAIRQAQLNPIPRARRIFSHNEGLTWMAIAIATSSLAQSALNSILFLYASVRLKWETKDTGYFLSMVGLSLLISQAVLAPLAVKYLGEVGTILIGYSLASVHYAIYGVARTTEMMYVGLFVGMFSFISDPAIKGLLARQVPSASQGSLQGSIAALSSIVKPFAPLLASTLFSYGSNIGMPGLPFHMMCGISAVSVLIARIAFWKPGLK